MEDETPKKPVLEQSWLRIPNGARVRHRLEGYEGVIDGLTEIVEKGSLLNPDKRSQYRINVGAPTRKLAAEDELLIVADADGLMIIVRAKIEYRRTVTKRFRTQLAAEKFVA